MNVFDWYGVRTLFEHEDSKQGLDRLYEERLVLVRAKSADEALTKGEEEAKQYARTLDRTAYLGFVEVFELNGQPEENVEIFSLMRESRMAPKAYITKHFDTGRERRK
jgi:hypothetical protein